MACVIAPLSGLLNLCLKMSEREEQSAIPTHTASRFSRTALNTLLRLSSVPSRSTPASPGPRALPVLGAPHGEGRRRQRGVLAGKVAQEERALVGVGVQLERVGEDARGVAVQEEAHDVRGELVQDGRAVRGAEFDQFCEQELRGRFFFK